MNGRRQLEPEQSLRVFSRWMPPLQTDRCPPFSITEWIVLATLVVVIGAFPASCLVMCVWSIVKDPRAIASLVAFLLVPALWMAYATWSTNRAERTVAKERQGEDIGSFARAIDRRTGPFDPWVVRAVWEAFLPYAGFPLRATDNLEEFGIEWLELFQLIEEVAERSAHSLKNLHEFRLDGATLGDLVTFVSSQPKRPAGA